VVTAPLDVFVAREAELARVAEVVTKVTAGQPWLALRIAA